MASQVMTAIQLMMVDTLKKPLPDSYVMMDTLFMEISQQAVKHQDTGVNRHQHAEVLAF